MNNDTKQYEFQTTHRVDAEFLHDVLCIAFDGGIGYWAQGRNVRRTSTYGITHCWVRDVREAGDDGVIDWTEMTADSVAEGIDRILTGKVQVRDDIVACIREAVSTNDCGHIDADASDVIVQSFLFNEIVFG